MKFKTSSVVEETSDENIFNAVSIYIPKSLAAAQFENGAYDADAVTATNYAVITVTADNYTKVLKTTSSLLSQWKAAFNDGANLAMTLYLIIFDDTGFSVTLSQAALEWEPLTKAFNELYFISAFKTLFSEHYNGNAVTSDPAADTDYDDSNYFDMLLCLSVLVENETTMSALLSEIHVDIFKKGASDTNVCKIMSLARGDETTHCTTLVGTTKADRAEYFWGYKNLIGGNRQLTIIHNGSYMIPVILGSWFGSPNDSGEYIGNKLAKIKLTGSNVKPTGLTSPLDSDVNLNLDSYIYDILDAKYVGYFITISDASNSASELTTDRDGQNYPLTASLIAKYIDYSCSQAMAEYRDALSTLTTPVLCNKTTYEAVQNVISNTIQKIGANGRLSNINIIFPPFSQAKKGNSLIGTAAWSADYVDDLGTVQVTGQINFES